MAEKFHHRARVDALSEQEGGGEKLAPGSASGIIADELATSAARYLGSKGGKQGGVKGGKARMETLTTDERSALGRRAAAARWGKARGLRRPGND